MTGPTLNRVLYAALAILNLMIGALLVEIGKGTVPIPEQWQWAVPVLLAALNGLALFLPRVGSEGLSVQVDALKAKGVHKDDMVVVTQDEAVGGIVNPADPDAVQKIADELERRRAERVMARLHDVSGDKP